MDRKMEGGGPLQYNMLWHITIANGLNVLAVCN